MFSQALRVLGWLAVANWLQCGVGAAADTTDEAAGRAVLSVQIAPREPALGQRVELDCTSANDDCSPWWTFKADNITADLARFQYLSSGKFIIPVHEEATTGNYTCRCVLQGDVLERTVFLDFVIPPRVVQKSPTIRLKLHSSAQLFCLIEGYPIERQTWLKVDGLMEPKFNISTTSRNETFVRTELTIPNVAKQDNGTYICGNDRANDTVTVLVLDKPHIKIDFIKALSTSSIFLNWTLNDGNDLENLSYDIPYMEQNKKEWTYYPGRIWPLNTSAVLSGSSFKANTTYTIRITAKNSYGTGISQNEEVVMLREDPNFVPDVKVTGATIDSITVSWTVVPADYKSHIHYFHLKSKPADSDAVNQAFHAATDANLYFFSGLQPATTYEFQVAACSEYTHECGNWSAVVNGTTNDGLSGPPENVSVECRFNNISLISTIFVSWKQPLQPRGKITNYNVEVRGEAYFMNENGAMENSTWGPKTTSVNEKHFNTQFYNISANTNYTIRVAAVTRTKKYGEQVEKVCTMPPTVPDKSRISRFTWDKIEDRNRWIFKLYMQRVSERNGPICCYRIFMVRLGYAKSVADLPPPENLEISTYHDAHRTAQGGAYVAEIISSGYMFQPEVFLGDEQQSFNDTEPCQICMGLPPNNNFYDTDRNAIDPQDTSESFADKLPTPIPRKTRSRREIPYRDTLAPYDGFLDTNSNYTGFVEVIVKYNDGQTRAYSNYFTAMGSGPRVLHSSTTGTLTRLLAGLALAAVALLAALCLLRRHSKRVARAQGVEMITFRSSFRNLCRSLRGRHRLVSVNPPDKSPIARLDLSSAFAERHKDSDYGFQQEFEQLPDKFSDRTTRASDARENMYKNRYPDIKAYDQTRVKLAQVDTIAGSDYINANFVMGYKERKKFICAQGPMDNTVCDHWRMIWEQHLEIILMLTNLEEYSKTKCAKYWPDKTDGEKTFGDIVVSHVSEKHYSDYIVRELRVAKATPVKDKEERVITQYHYLVWKDFMAPEHPHGIIKFIKRVNEVYSLERGSILVHCSAGVGRTGTLVALDSLLQQLAEEDQVTVFNTICDLRHQRNFLVQSLKQYIFVYRALMEVAMYGDKEITAAELKKKVEEMKQAKDGEKSKMELEYEKIKGSEEKKMSAVGSAEENRCRNRSDSVRPYDQNRVILTPLIGREHSTYINASFIEGYDHMDSFIITQDPLETTVADFWRMISEQNIAVVVMLSELGDGPKKATRYWPDDEVSYDHINVRYIQSESCPYFTRREFSVSNVKSSADDSVLVTQFQYHGWPTVEGEVPEVTRGLIELHDQAQAAQERHGFAGPLLAHCSCGSDRSSMFIGLCILVQQIKAERRVDIFTTARKLRSQRQMMLDTYAQYEFLHRAIVNYVDLHQLIDET